MPNLRAILSGKNDEVTELRSDNYLASDPLLSAQTHGVYRRKSGATRNTTYNSY